MNQIQHEPLAFHMALRPCKFLDMMMVEILETSLLVPKFRTYKEIFLIKQQNIAYNRWFADILNSNTAVFCVQ